MFALNTIQRAQLADAWVRGSARPLRVCLRLRARSGHASDGMCFFKAIYPHECPPNQAATARYELGARGMRTAREATRLSAHLSFLQSPCSAEAEPDRLTILCPLTRLMVRKSSIFLKGYMGGGNFLWQVCVCLSLETNPQMHSGFLSRYKTSYEHCC